MKKRNISLLLSMLLYGLIPAQDHMYESELQKVTSTDFYSIQLLPDLTSHLSETGGNVRIIDPEGNDVPYIMNREKQSELDFSLNWLPTSGNQYHERWYSKSFFKNNEGKIMDELVLKIRNADVRQRFWLSGSDDMTHWYIIKEDFAYQADYDPNSYYNLLTIHFPPVNYKYFKVEMRHFWQEPIQIMGAGYYEVKESKGNYNQVPAPRIRQVDKPGEKKSVITLKWENRHYFDRLFFEIDGPERYHRNAVIEYRDKENSDGFIRLGDMEISSKNLSMYDPETFRTNEIRITIFNKDDKPIRISGFRGYQLKRFLVAKLEKDKSYQIALGNELLEAPEYDIEFFRKEINSHGKNVTYTAPIKKGVEQNINAEQPEISYSTEPGTIKGGETTNETVKIAGVDQKIILWVGISCIILLVGLMSLKMLKDLKNEEKS